MFEKVNRSGLIIYLYYNRDAKNCRIMEILPIIPRNIVTCSFMVPTQEVEQLVGAWARKIYKKLEFVAIQELETPFVGNLYREENVIIEKFKKSVDNFLIIRYILNMLFI